MESLAWRWPLSDPAIWPPQQIALYTSERAISCDQLARRVDDVIAQIQQHGIAQGTHIGCSAANSYAVLLLLLACLKGGWVYAPLNPRYPLAQRQRLMQEMDIAACLQDKAEREPLPDGVVALVLDLQREPQAPHHLPALNAEQRASLTLTSGSSGHPKAVLHRLKAHLANARASQSVLPLSCDSCWLLSLPLFHIGGIAIVIRSLLHGSPMALVDNHISLIQQLSQLPVTHISLVATQLYRLLQHAEFNPQQLALSHLMLGGGPLPDGLLKQAQQRGFASFVTYGMTETASQIITAENRLAGQQPHILWRIRQGELQVKGESLFAGYYRCGELQRPLDSDGFFATRDRACEQAGVLSITGRMDNLFISGGENIQPEEIEQLLLHHPDIEQAIVVAVDDAEFGQRPVAVVQSNAPLSEAELQGWLQPKLARFKHPVRYLPWPEQELIGFKPSRRVLQTYAAKTYLNLGEKA